VPVVALTPARTMPSRVQETFGEDDACEDGASLESAREGRAASSRSTSSPTGCW
jgi:hypothetical protein